MIRTLILLAGLIACAAPLAAQTVTVRSGEHEGFTRFVLNLPRGADWSIERGEARAALSLSPGTPVFDTGSVFARIPRSRVRDLRQPAAGGPLVFDLNCACEISTFIHDGTFLVIDIRDPAEGPQPRRAEAPLFGPRLPILDEPYRFRFSEPGSGTGRPVPPPRDDRSASVQAPATASGPEATEPIRLPLVRHPVTPQVAMPIPAPEPEQGLPNAEQLAAVGEMEARLLEQIERAADQGLIEPARPPVAHDPVDVPGAEDPAPAEPEPGEADPRRNIAVTTSIDRDLDYLARRLAGQGDHGRCLPSEAVALADWAEGDVFADEVARWRGRLVGEFDQVDRQAAFALARAYLHFGFGAEARQVLDMLPEPTRESRLLDALAEIIDDGAVTGANPFADQLACDSDAALWAAVSQPDRLTAANQDSVMQAIARLPVPLREYIGSGMADRYARAGRAETASTILRAIGRVVDTPAPGFKLATASTAALLGHGETASIHRAEVAETNAQQSPQALIDLVDSGLRTNATVPPDLPQLAAAMATEHRHDSYGPPLRRANALALALTGAFPEAFDMLGEIARTDGAEAADPVRIDLLTLLTDRADDLTFLHYGLNGIEGREFGLPDALGNALARRLLDLGFARPAVRLLAGSQQVPTGDARRLLRAEAALGENLPHEALVALLGIEGAEAARLRASAMLMQQDHARAAPLLLEAEQSDAAGRSFWLAGQPGAVPVETGERYARAAELTGALARDDTAKGAPTPLARARALIADSNAARSGIEELLSDLPVDGVAGH